MVIQKEQKVAVFVDVQNMYYSARQIYNKKVNFREILKAGVSGRRLIRAFAYVIKADMKEEQPFFDALEKIGFEIKAKELQTFVGGAKKGDWDVGIAMDMVRMASKIDAAVLVSGDGDFRALLEYMRSNGCRTEVIAFGKAASHKMFEESDDYIDMDKDTRRFLINERSTRTPRKEQRKDSNSEQSQPQ